MQQQRWSQLVAWYLAQKRDLPWRRRPTPYRVWVSEIMLQQTQVAVVIPYFQRWMRRFPSVESLAAADVSQVLELWAGLGYYRRARSLHDGARLIVDQGFPKDQLGWLAIPGVGPYTAGAICSIALGQNEPIVDGNVERVLSRIYCAERDLAKTWQLSGRALRHAVKAGAKPGDFNQALMELGATVCAKAAPLCGVCPVARGCLARRRGMVGNYPRPKLKASVVHKKEHVLVLIDAAGHALLTQTSGKWRAGLWDFPAESDVKISRNAFHEDGSHLVGEFTLKYAVTRHRVERKHSIMRVNKRGALALVVGAARWVELRNPDCAVGAPTRRAMEHISVSDVSQK